MDTDTGDITSDAASGITSDATGDHVWMTYAELSRARGITPASAKRLALRRHWRRQPGNDQRAKVAVPVTEVTPRESVTGDATSDDADDTVRPAAPVTSDITRISSAFEAALTVLREQLL